MALNPLDVRAAKPRSIPYKLADEKGLFLLVQPSGAKLWRLKYRFHKIERKLSLGQYPEVSLKDARDRRDEARRMVEGGGAHPERAPGNRYNQIGAWAIDRDLS